MTPGQMAALFGTLLVLAAMPSVSVLVVSARAAASGFAHGALVATGIVVGDLVFISVAIYSLSFLVEMMGTRFVLIKYLGGAYLICLGITLWRPAARGAVKFERDMDASLLSCFLSGLFLTLGDQKAILFYLGLFPAFLDLNRVGLLDTGIIVAIATVAVGGAKLGYAFMADRASALIGRTRVFRVIQLAAGGAVIGAGVFLLVEALIHR